MRKDHPRSSYRLASTYGKGHVKGVMPLRRKEHILFLWLISGKERIRKMDLKLEGDKTKPTKTCIYAELRSPQNPRQSRSFVSFPFFSFSMNEA